MWAIDDFFHIINKLENQIIILGKIMFLENFGKNLNNLRYIIRTGLDHELIRNKSQYPYDQQYFFN